jgi:hypothetical protein
MAAFLPWPSLMANDPVQSAKISAKPRRDGGVITLPPSPAYVAPSFPSITTAFWFAGLIASDFR